MYTKISPIILLLDLALLATGYQFGDPAAGTFLTQGGHRLPAQCGLIPQSDQPLASDISSGDAFEPVAADSLLEPYIVVEQFLMLHINSVRGKMEGMVESPVADIDYDQAIYLSYEFYIKFRAAQDEQINNGDPGKALSISISLALLAAGESWISFRKSWEQMFLHPPAL